MFHDPIHYSSTAPKAVRDTIEAAPDKGITVQWHIGDTGLIYLVVGVFLLLFPALWGFGVLFLYFGLAMGTIGVVTKFAEWRTHKNARKSESGSE